MPELKFEKLWKYLAEELSAEDREKLEEYILQCPTLFEIVEGLKKLEAELPDGITPKAYLEFRKEFLSKKIFGKKK